MDNGYIDVNMGRLQVAEAPTILATGGIGSCVAVCLYSSRSKKGGLAHIMLPRRLETATAPLSDLDLRYADVAIQVMVTQLADNGVDRHELVAKIVGGSNMFPDIQGRSVKVGQKNVDAIREILDHYPIRLAAEETGGSTGRAITFDLNNGIVTVKMTI